MHLVLIEFIKEEKGKHFDPVLVDIFIKHIDEILEIREYCSDDKLNDLTYECLI